MLWLKRMQWADHLRGCNLKHLIPASPLPDREEKVLQRTVELNSLCTMSGLSVDITAVGS
jgi:hypothetical protein